MYNSTIPFDRKKSLSMLKSHANYKPTGSTFDVRHLEKLLFSKNSMDSFRSSKPRYTWNEDVFHKIPYKSNKLDTSRNSNFPPDDTLRPSPSFLTVHRDIQKQSIYCDQYDGPSSLIKLSPDRKRDFIKAEKMVNPYQQERDRFRRSVSEVELDNFTENRYPNLPALKKINLWNPKVLKSSKQQYEEFLEQKRITERQKQLKMEKDYLTKRDRIIKHSYRHGVVGVECPDDPDSEIYKDIFMTKSIWEKGKELINSRRRNLIKSKVG
jgi:hypothetical protein